MNTSNFAQKLRSERMRLGHTQHYVADLLCMAQPTYSRMENGETNPGVKRSQEIIKILEPHGYNEIPPIEFEEIEGDTVIKIRWPWNKKVLYVLLALVVLLAIDFMASAPGDLSRGFNDGDAGEADPAPFKTMIATLLFLSGVIYGIYRLTKWLLLKRS